MKSILLVLLILLVSILKAQDNVTDLITDRPDQTESSAVVPHKSLQIETGFVMENDEDDLYKQNSFAYNTTLFRYGLLNNMELRLGLEYLEDKIEDKNTGVSNTYSGAGPLYTGFKVYIFEEQNWIPEIAFLGGLIFPFSANNNYKTAYSAGNIRFSLSHTLSERFSLGYNIGAEWDGESAAPGYFYSIALGIGLFNNFGIFVESFGIIPEDSNEEHLFDTGFTYLVMSNLQLDISGGIGINNSAIDKFIAFGVSYRLPQ